MATLEDVLASIDANAQGALDRLFELVRIPSISAQPAHYPDCDRAADWLAAQLGELGFDAKKMPTEGRPMVMGAARAKTRDAPHVLFYGHYDVQPADPLELWTSPPFEPQLVADAGRRANRRARRGRRQGAVDDVPGGVPRLQGERRAAVPCLGAAGRRGGDRLAFVAGFPGRERQGAEGGPAAGVRHQHVERRDPGDHHHAARARVRGGGAEGCQPRPAFRPLWRAGDQPDPGVGQDPRRVARRQRRGDAAGLL